MVRLTADLIWKSPHFFNVIKERELDLRGNKIAVIENLGATEDQFDTIDLSDNEIVKLENFPYLNRLGTLLINNNRITRINLNLGEFLPKLHTLVLTNNRLVNLVEIDPLVSLPKLQFLSLLDNNITKKPNYRLYVIHRLKKLRLLDFRKVKQKERTEAERLFASKEAEEEAKKVVIPKTFTPVEVPTEPNVSQLEQPPKVTPTLEQITAIKLGIVPFVDLIICYMQAAIINSQTLEEVARLEKALKLGQIPEEFMNLGKETNASEDMVVDTVKVDDQNEGNEVQDNDQNEDVQPIEQTTTIVVEALGQYAKNHGLAADTTTVKGVYC
ncbi:hypothetical protein ZIOFF_052990 [Zingiber officinale]|uniref:Uncharacterized protein n=1 Tax=Zingiber officinale TaxID=94328 RepID=A0A8J5KCM5_ZINOF|nr:hypothetical protein ZIOFF_052990 [Zingiber officinale]